MHSCRFVVSLNGCRRCSLHCRDGRNLAKCESARPHRMRMLLNPSFMQYDMCRRCRPGSSGGPLPDGHEARQQRRLRVCGREEPECLRHVRVHIDCQSLSLTCRSSSLQERKRTEWGDRVELLFGDMRALNVPEQVDILVSELLGSFGDNELSPECLDGAMRFLKRTLVTAAAERRA